MSLPFLDNKEVIVELVNAINFVDCLHTYQSK